jgi:hypothetical protein
MPCYPPMVATVFLNLAAECICRGERNLRVHTFVADKTSETVVNDSVAIPAIE